MSDVLSQKKAGIARKEFRLTDTSVFIRERKNQKEWEYSVPYENIGFETVIKKEINTNKAFIVTAVLFAISLAGVAMLFIHPPQAKDRVMYFTMPLFAVLFAFLTVKGWLQRNLVYEYLTGGHKTIELFKDSPDLESYAAFKTALYEKVKTFHKKRLLYDEDMNTPFELFAERIYWLKRINAINEEEIQEFQRKLNTHQHRHLN